MATDQSLSWSKDIMIMLQRLSSGWFARYQIYAIGDEPKLVLDVRNPLDQTKVWTQLQHSLW